jgi:PAS domain-containing protein
MLAPDGYDADGFKIDFTARIPSGPGMKLHGSLWGLELMKLYLSILYEEAKSVKNDALLIAHTPHPYLADVVDMIRLNDIIKEKDVEREMRIRAKVASIACPGAIIDTDNWPVVNRAAWRKYLGIQAELGIPSLYFTTHIDVTGEPLQEEDYRRLRSVWAKHRMRNDATNRRRKESPLATLAFLKPCLGQIRTWALKFRQTCPEKRSGKAARST